MMRVIGLIGGMSWESSAAYYRLLNETVRHRLGGLHSARIVMVSVDFAEIAQMQAEGHWAEAGAVLADAAKALERAGADFILIATNTMHKVADAVMAATRIPLLHIADITVDALRTAGRKRPLLLATRFTMEQSFYREKLVSAGLSPIIPDKSDRDDVHRIIYEELCCGIIKEDSKQIYLAVIARARAYGMDSVIFGCTEIGLLLASGDVPEGAFDTTELHVLAAVEKSLAMVEKAA
jgi:aspartate racemase